MAEGYLFAYFCARPAQPGGCIRSANDDQSQGEAFEHATAVPIEPSRNFVCWLRWDVVNASSEGHLTDVQHYGITNAVGGRRGYAASCGTRGCSRLYLRWKSLLCLQLIAHCHSLSARL